MDVCTHVVSDDFFLNYSYNLKPKSTKVPRDKCNVRDIVSRDTKSRDIVSRDTTSRDTKSRDIVSKDNVSRETKSEDES